MNQYQLSYLDATIVDNHDVMTEDQVITEIKKRYAILPRYVHIENYDGAWVEYSATWQYGDPLFENTEHLLKNAGRMIEFFSVRDQDGNEVLTEQ